ncbi:MAG: hypothetical protein Q7S19_03980 [bacterium]|nr:hypothetical protein [bacterium]
MFKEFLMKKMLQSQLKGSGMTDEQQNKLIEMVTKNPELFKKIAEEAQQLMGNQGMGQMQAIMKVSEKYKAELGGLADKFK